MITKTFKLTIVTDTEEQMQKEEEYLAMVYGAEEIGEAIREALDRLSEAFSEINVEEVCKRIKEQREQGERDGAQN